MFNETPVVSSTRWALSRLIGICTAEQERQPDEMRQPVGTRHRTTPDRGLTAAWKGPSVKEGRTHWVRPPGCPSVTVGLRPLARPEPTLECTGHGPCPTGHGVRYGKSSTSTDLWSATGKKCWHLNLVTMGCWCVLPCDGEFLEEVKRGDAARQV